MGYENPLAIQPIAKTGSLNKQPDQSLIKAVAASDQRAMRALYERHSSGVLRFISRLNVDVGEAEDLVSEVFIDVWNHAGEFEGRSQVSTWILAIARFKALTTLRRRRDLDLDEAAVELIEDTGDTPEQTIVNQDLIPTRRETDSWDSQISGTMIQDGNRGGCHGPRCCGADGLHCRQGSPAGETGEGCGASAAAAGDRGGP